MCTKQEIKEVLEEQQIVTKLECQTISSAFDKRTELMQKDIKSLCTKTDAMSDKLDIVINKKADKSEVDGLKKRINGLTVATVTTIFAVLIQIIFFLLTKMN